jgi:hypothetical protein
MEQALQRHELAGAAQRREPLDPASRSASRTVTMLTLTPARRNNSRVTLLRQPGKRMPDDGFRRGGRS